MLEKQEAKEQLLQYLNTRYEKADDEIIILDEWISERPYGWIFSYESKKYFETDNVSYALIGCGPIVIEKVDGTMHELGTSAYDPADEIRDFEIRRFGKSDYETPNHLKSS